MRCLICVRANNAHIAMLSESTDGMPEQRRVVLHRFAIDNFKTSQIVAINQSHSQTSIDGVFACEVSRRCRRRLCVRVWSARVVLASKPVWDRRWRQLCGAVASSRIVHPARVRAPTAGSQPSIGNGKKSLSRPGRTRPQRAL